MRVLIDVVHPAQAHFFLPLVRRLQDEGHTVCVTSRDKDVTVDLLRAHRVSHTVLSRARPGKGQRLWELVQRDRALVSRVRSFRPDVIVAKEGAAACQVGWWTGVPVLAVDDTDDAWLQRWLSLPFASRVLTDEAYPVRYGVKHLTYRGISPLAYLAPRPPQSVRSTPRVLVRLVRWDASHDWGKAGMPMSQIDPLLEALEKETELVISSERPLSARWEPYRFSGGPEAFHDGLARCHLAVGESATLAAEAVVLGVPAVYLSPRRLWYTRELERRGLIRHCGSVEGALHWSRQWASDPEERRNWAARQQAYFARTDDLRQRLWEAVEQTAGSPRKKRIFKL